MEFITVFFSEDVGKVVIVGDVLDVDKVGLLRFANCIFTHLEMAEAFGGLGGGPGDTGVIVIVQRDGG